MSFAINVPTATIGQSTTCLACGIRLPSLETQQLHHKSDWHTYNLKRKMVSLPPVSSEVFAHLVNTSREQANPEEVPQPECIPCSKKYLSFQAYDNHVNSKKHKQTVIAHEKRQQQQNDSSLSTKEDLESASTTAGAVEHLEPSETVCLFCSHQATDAASNYAHMRSSHSFFLPSSERLIDLAGILTYLAEKLVENYNCFWCTPSVFSQNLRPDQELHAGFSSLASVRRHMIDKGHCKLAMDQGAEREYTDFYLTVDAYEDEDEEKDHNLEHNEALEDSAMDTDDEDQKRLNMVLLDDEGNWILDNQGGNVSGIRVDPITNELILNNRRLAHKDAARRQKVESRTVTLAPRARRRPSGEAASTEAGASADQVEEEEGVSSTSDSHHPEVKISNALLKSQNQLSQSTMAVSNSQLNKVALMVAKAQDFESVKRERAATRLGTNNNITTRAHCPAPWGTKV
ncbi:hypothetical protein EDD11_005310 [Mortierella claussenii]|nr:hypothetical protein EDD11_005310 [Mortierella claussenii]